ncbi:MAG: SUMF1/EgtB/PvdO family nonheme iron enzyme [Akkermansiaceae bacterium]|nr:SUMF1/EgtB/PvdO family nonheme iron enzyme [Akkermansiaceae bacterium]
MIDDAFLRQVAALQANLKMLESQSDALSDLADMKELRLYKAHLTDYIEAHASAGDLPRDPFQAIEQRLSALSEFFAAADQECKRLNSWKADWLNSVPAVGLADLQSARTELAELVAEVPQIQDRLRQRLSPLDWDTSSATVDLHAELLACAQCASGLKLPLKTDSRQKLYQFARGEWAHAMETSAHLTAMGLRIEELIALHADHVKTVAEGEALLAKQNFRRVGKMLEEIGRNKFSDIHYSNLESGLKKQLALVGRFAALASSIKERLSKGELKAVTEELRELSALAGNPASEFGHETSELLKDADAQMASFLRGRRKTRNDATVLLVVGLVGAVALAGYVIKEDKKATLAKIEAMARAEREAGEAAEAKAKAEQEAAEARAKAEQEAAEAKAKADKQAAEAKAKLLAEISAGRVGATLGVPLAGKAIMTFAFCPAGSFEMHISLGGFILPGEENRPKVTLSKDFWMAKTEVTGTQWCAVMGGNPSDSEGDELPHDYVSWNNAKDFIKKMNDSGCIPDGWAMALPTEAQWEYSCRAGETGPYSGGTREQVAWHGGNSENKTHPVGTKKPNAWGLHDMHGNVSEWCADWYGNTFTLPGGTDPSGPSTGVDRSLRGGSWITPDCRADSRGWSRPDARDYSIGFRPALVPSK